MQDFHEAPIPLGVHPGGRDLLVQGARLWPTTALVDISIRGGRIDALGPAGSDPLLGAADREVLDAKGRSVIPGLVDVHVHFRDPGLEYKEGWRRGSRGAVHGGVTSVVEVQNNPPLTISAARMRERQAHVVARSLVDFGLLGNLLEDSLPELEELAKQTPAFKLFLGCSTGLSGQSDEATIRRLFAGAARAGRMVVAHCEHEATLDADAAAHPNATAAEHHLVRSAKAEERSIEQALKCLRLEGGALHVFHITSRAGVEVVRRARKEGLPVFASTAPHYALLSCEDAATLGNFLRVNPSVKTLDDREAILEGLRDGTIDAIGTDHAPHPLEHKTRPYNKAPSGMPSIDLLWPLTLELVRRGKLEPELALDIVTRKAADSMRLGDKGRLAVGFDGDLVLFDPEATREVRGADLPSTSKWSAYEGWQLAGFPEVVVRRGEVLLADGQFTMDDEAAGGAPLRLEAVAPTLAPEGKPTSSAERVRSE